MHHDIYVNSTVNPFIFFFSLSVSLALSLLYFFFFSTISQWKCIVSRLQFHPPQVTSVKTAFMLQFLLRVQWDMTWGKILRTKIMTYMVISYLYVNAVRKVVGSIGSLCILQGNTTHGFSSRTHKILRFSLQLQIGRWLTYFSS